MKGLSGVRVCMATSSHAADDDRIFFKEARSLAKAGVEVTVLCAAARRPPADPAGVRFVCYEGGGGLARRAMTLRALERALSAERFDVVHCHEPDALLAAVRVKRRTGVKVIFDSHEMWWAVAAGRFPQAVWPVVAMAWRRLEQGWLARCDAAIGASWAISEYLNSILGRERVATILNVPVVEVFGEREEKAWEDETILCHEGHLTFDRGLKTMAEAARLLALRHPVVFKIVGDVFGPESAWLQDFVRRHDLERVIVRTGWLPYTEVGKALAPCHIGLIAMQPLPNHRVAAPNKLFNYLLYGIPVVAPDFPCAHFKVVANEGCAILVDPRSPQALADAVSGLILDRRRTIRMSAQARHMSRTKYCWQHMEPVLFKLYDRALGGHR